MRFFKVASMISALSLIACDVERPPIATAQQGLEHPAAEQSSTEGNLDRLPPSILGQMLDPTRSVGFPQLAWPAQEVTVAFLGGSQQLREIVEASANEWIVPGSRISLSFRRPDGRFRTWSENDSARAADIRIAFYTDTRGGYWSSVGTLARRINPNAPTMNLGDLTSRLAGSAVGDSAWRTTYSHTVILHEFGHALGLNHEQFHDQCQRDVMMEQAVAALATEQQWHPDVARFNLDASYYFRRLREGGVPGSAVSSPNIDRDSVMLYNLNPRFLTSGAGSLCLPNRRFATTLSPGDRDYFAATYVRR